MFQKQHNLHRNVNKLHLSVIRAIKKTKVIREKSTKTASGYKDKCVFKKLFLLYDKDDTKI